VKYVVSGSSRTDRDVRILWRLVSCLCVCMLTGSPGHLKTFDYTGPYRYFLTFCTESRQRVFVTRARVELVLMHFERSAAEQQFALIAYCFMPDHLHLFVQGQNESSECRRFINRAKQFSGFHYARAYGRGLWQRYGFERVLRDDQATLGVARYIVENPLRARLVDRVENYPFVGSRVYSISEILGAVSLDGRPLG
jgi:putative transposase